MRTSFCQGAHHDFRLFRQNRLAINPATVLFADLGYLGIDALHASACIPHKASKLKKLTAEQKRENRTQRKQRIVIEHTFAFIKRFKIFSTPYRNRRKRFCLRFNLLSAIFNLELSLP
jgi:hypothetical protein